MVFNTMRSIRAALLSKQESWFETGWRPALAFMFILVIAFDFLVMPVVYEVSNAMMTPNDAVVESLKYPPAEQAQVLATLTTKRVWQPLTLQGGGLFFLSLGAILTGASVTRGMEKTERLRQIGQLNENDLGPVDTPPIDNPDQR